MKQANRFNKKWEKGREGEREKESKKQQQGKYRNSPEKMETTSECLQIQKLNETN